MYELFYYCSSLEELDISNFNINNKASFGGAFYGCSEELKKKVKEQNVNIEV